MPPSEIWLVRHGESEWNARGLWQGQADPPLTPAGAAHAREVGKALEGQRPVAVVASDLRRAAVSAAEIAEACGLPLQTDVRLREMDVGRWSGLGHRAIERRWPDDYRRYQRGDPTLMFGGGESRQGLHARVRPAVDELARAHPGGRVLVVTHGGVIRTLVPGAQPRNLDVVRLRVRSV